MHPRAAAGCCASAPAKLGGDETRSSLEELKERPHRPIELLFPYSPRTHVCRNVTERGRQEHVLCISVCVKAAVLQQGGEKKRERRKHKGRKKDDVQNGGRTEDWLRQSEPGEELGEARRRGLGI